MSDRGTIGTKFAPTPWRGDAQSIVDACRGSAARLGREQVPLMQVHMPDIIQPFKALGVETRREEAHWDGLAECYHEGLAANVGVSNYGPTLLARCHEYLAKRGVPLASNQIHLNLLYRRQGSLETVEACNELGVACLAYYPLAMGLLTGKLTAASLRGRTDTRSRELLRYLEGGQGGGFPNTAGDIPQGGIRTLLIVIEEVAARLSKTPAQVSLNWFAPPSLPTTACPRHAATLAIRELSYSFRPSALVGSSARALSPYQAPHRCSTSVTMLARWAGASRQTTWRCSMPPPIRSRSSSVALASKLRTASL
jgi:aryl-alcohol dehydrogenase-like predicted oxidoreductase